MGKGDFQGLYRSVLIFGPPGSGKGTMGKFLSHVSEHYHLSSGDIFRSLNPDSKGGKLSPNMPGKGVLCPMRSQSRSGKSIWKNWLTRGTSTSRNSFCSWMGSLERKIKSSSWLPILILRRLSFCKCLIQKGLYQE